MRYETLTPEDAVTSMDEARSRDKLIDGALSWFSQNLEQFNPFKGGDEADDFFCKPLLELSLACMLYIKRAGPHRDERIARFVSFIHDIWRRPDYGERLIRNQEMLLVYGMTWIALRRCGVTDTSGDDLVQRVLDQRYALSVEQLPFRTLDFCYMLECGGYRHDLPSYATIYRQTLLAKSPPVLYLTDTDAYAVTHVIFYLSGFGMRSLDDVLNGQMQDVRWIVEALLAIYLRLRHWDLVAELLICCECLQWRPPLLYECAWRALTGAQRPEGVVPGPYFSEQKMRELEETERQGYYVKQNYHTTIVSALAVFLSDGWVANAVV
jgi:hypothetical protein